jgi:3-oxoacyl-[acyl-carrier protein] reductase
MKLLGKVAIVTGGSGHIGRAIVRELVKEGADVVFTYLTDEKNTNILLEEVKQYNKKVLAIRCDIRNFEDIKKVVDKTLNEFKKIDILVNNAGSTVQDNVENITDDGWNICINIDLKGTFYFAKLIVPTMKKLHYGKIINIASMVATGGIPRHSLHGAAKAGMVGFTRNLAMELAEHNINVNSISPGTIRAKFPNEFYEKWAPIIPLKRVGEPEDVAKAVVFLASSDSNFITGEDLVIDGGQSRVIRYD